MDIGSSSIERSSAVPFVVFEGLDGVGKSTTARHFAKVIGAEFLATPDRELAEARRLLEPVFEAHPEARMLWYAATVMRVSDRVKGLLRLGRPVVVDRYFLSTLAYAALRGANLGLTEVEGVLVVPDLTVFLYAPLSVRDSRMRLRSLNSTEDRSTLDAAVDAKLERSFRGYAGRPVAGRFVAVDASVRSPGEISEMLVQMLGLRTSCGALSGVVA